MTKKDKFINDINFLIDLSNQTNKNNLVSDKLKQLKFDFYQILSQELKEQHKTYINLLNNK